MLGRAARSSLLSRSSDSGLKFGKIETETVRRSPAGVLKVPFKSTRAEAVTQVSVQVQTEAAHAVEVLLLHTFTGSFKLACTFKIRSPSY
jgi:hypothetical protein